MPAHHQLRKQMFLNLEQRQLRKRMLLSLEQRQLPKQILHRPVPHWLVPAQLRKQKSRQWKRRKWLSLLCFLLVLLVAFSRNFLGVHTPQDVLVGIAVAFLVIVFNTWLIRHLAGNEKRQDIWTAAGFIFVIACILVIEFKSYPMDYGADGTLIVDPQAMKKDAYMAAGTVLGFLAGSLWERKRIRFDASGTGREKVIRCVIGLVPAAGIYLGIRKLLAGWIGVNVGNLVGMFLLAFFVVGVYPWCVMKMKEKKSGARAS